MNPEHKNLYCAVITGDTKESFENKLSEELDSFESYDQLIDVKYSVAAYVSSDGVSHLFYTAVILGKYISH